MNKKKYKKDVSPLEFDFGGFLGDVGRTLLDTALTPVEGITGKNFYDPKMQTKFGTEVAKASNVLDDITSAALPLAANIVAPGIGGAGVALARGITNPLIEDQTKEAHLGFQGQREISQLTGLSAGILSSPYLAQELGTNTYEGGGNLDMTHYEGNSHQMGGIPLGNTNNEVEGGEVRVEDYIFSDSLKPEGNNYTFAQLAKKVDRKYGLRKNDAAANRAKSKELEALMGLNEEARILAEQNTQVEGLQDAMNYGGMIEYKNGGIFIKPENRGKFTEAAKKRGLGVQEFASQVLANKDKYSSTLIKRAQFAKNATKFNHALGGDLVLGDPTNPLLPLVENTDEFGVIQKPMETLWDLENYKQYGQVGDQRDPRIVAHYKNIMNTLKGQHGQSSVKFQDGGDLTKQVQYLEQDLANNPLRNEFLAPENFIIDPVTNQPIMNTRLDLMENPDQFTAPQYSDTGLTLIPNSDTNTLADRITSESPNKKSTTDLPFGREEAALTLANMGNIYNLVQGIKGPEETTFERYTPTLIDLEKQREAARKQAASARAITGENIRGNATTSGQALANLSAANTQITKGLIDADLQSWLSQDTTNANIRNQAGQINTEIANQELIARQQDKARAMEMQQLGLVDLGMTGQAYLRDKAMTAENQRYNTQVTSVINNLFPNYSWGVNPQNDDYMIQFASSYLNQGGK